MALDGDENGLRRHRSTEDNLRFALAATELRFQEERDRRYSEVNVEREKALKIKETADLAALQLAREIQTYKDEKANMLREQISSERGLYATNDDLLAAMDKVFAASKPATDYMTGQMGRASGAVDIRMWFLAAVAIAAMILSFVQFMVR